MERAYLHEMVMSELGDCIEDIRRIQYAIRSDGESPFYADAMETRLNAVRMKLNALTRIVSEVRKAHMIR